MDHPGALGGQDAGCIAPNGLGCNHCAGAIWGRAGRTGCSRRISCVQTQCLSMWSKRFFCWCSTSWHILSRPQDRTHTLEDPQPKALTGVPIPYSVRQGDLSPPRFPLVGRVLVHPHTLHIDTLLTPFGVGPRGFCPCLTPQPPRARLAPYLCHRLATSLIAPILLYGADHFTPNVGSFTRLNTFWHKVQRWATNSFLSTPISILDIESCLPPIPLIVSQRQRLAPLRTVCSPSGVNWATARLHPSFPSLSSYWAPDGSRAHTKDLSSVYLRLS